MGSEINTSYTVNSRHPASITDRSLLVPEQTAPTIGDRMNDKNVSWAWYSGGWNNAVIGHPDPIFQFHHQPFAFYAKYADGTPGRAAHLKDETDFYSDVMNGKLPSVSFAKPLGLDNEHAGYATELNGQQHLADLVSTIQNSQYWNDTAIIITYDEHGGPLGSRCATRNRPLGTRAARTGHRHIPLCEKGFVDHTQYDTTAFLKLIEERWDLQALGERDAKSGDLLSAFDFTHY